jgi:hypothetical protein
MSTATPYQINYNQTKLKLTNHDNSYNLTLDASGGGVMFDNSLNQVSAYFTRHTLQIKDPETGGGSYSTTVSKESLRIAEGEMNVVLAGGFTNEKKLGLVVTDNSDANATRSVHYSKNGISVSGSSTQSFDISMQVPLSINSSYGLEGQVLMTDVSGIPHWEDIPTSPTPSLAEVLAVSPAGVANAGQTISGIASIGLQTDASMVEPIIISENSGGKLDISSVQTGNVIDTSKSIQSFTGDYLIICLNGTEYRLPLFQPA